MIEKLVWFSRPGVASVFTPSLDTFREYNTSAAVTIIRIVEFIGTTTRLSVSTRVGTLIMATIYLQLIQNRYMFRSFTVLQCSHQHCVQPVEVTRA